MLKKNEMKQKKIQFFFLFYEFIVVHTLKIKQASKCIDENFNVKNV